MCLISMHVCLNKDEYAPPPPVCPATTVARSYLDFSTNLSGPFSASFVQNYFPLLKYIFNITFRVFPPKFSPPCNLAFRSKRCPQCTVAGSGTIIWRAFYNTAQEKRKRCMCMPETSGNVHACVSETVWEVSVYETVQTIVCWMFPAFKGF